MVERYGVEHPSQSEEIKQKTIQTNIQRYGVEHPAQCTEIMNKVKETNLKRRGVQFPLQSKEVKDKSMKTIGERYGVDNVMKSKDIQDKSKNTCKEKYGSEYVTQTDWFKEVAQESCISRYGVRNYSQTKEFHKKAHRKYTNKKYPEVKFGSSWEFKVYNYFIEHGIKFKYQDITPIQYEYSGEKFYYEPDFQLENGQIIEVKGDHFFRINKSTGKEEMFKPWKNKEWTDEYYDWLCQKEEAKHQCMLTNKVIILRQNDICNLISGKLKIDSFIKSDQTY